jgi:hypothetical protein
MIFIRRQPGECSSGSDRFATTARRGDDTLISIPSDIIFVGTDPHGVTRCFASLTTRADRTSSYTFRFGMGWARGIPGFRLGDIVLAPNPESSHCSIASGLDNARCNPASGPLKPPPLPGGTNVLLVNGTVHHLKHSTRLSLM